MFYKLAAFDLDGTLLDDEKHIPEKNLRAMEEANRRGLILVPATGRIFAALPEELRRLPFLRYFITVNGAHVYDAREDRVLYKGEISLETALETIEHMKSLPVIYDCYQDNSAYMNGEMYDRAEEFFPDQPHMLEMVKRLRQRVDELGEFLRERGGSVQKLQMFFKEEDMALRSRELQLLPGLFPELRATSSVKNNIELNSADAGKDKALRALCGELGIDMPQTIAFGDGTNDSRMLETAGVGVAMANADESVKLAADMVSLNNNEAGFAAALNMLMQR